MVDQGITNRELAKMVGKLQIPDDKNHPVRIAVNEFTDSLSGLVLGIKRDESADKAVVQRFKRIREQQQKWRQFQDN